MEAVKHDKPHCEMQPSLLPRGHDTHSSRTRNSIAPQGEKTRLTLSEYHATRKILKNLQWNFDVAFEQFLKNSLSLKTSQWWKYGFRIIYEFELWTNEYFRFIYETRKTLPFLSKNKQQYDGRQDPQNKWLSIFQISKLMKGTRRPIRGTPNRFNSLSVIKLVGEGARQ